MAIALSLLSAFPSGIRAQTDSLVDVFPLAIGNQWTYRYFTLMYNWPAGNPVETRTDSGRVVYHVSARANSADSTRWQFRLTRDLARHQILYDPVSRDTTYPIRDTSFFELIENHQGQHQLYRNADPYAIHQDVFPFTKGFTDTTRIYRFRSVGNGDTVTFRSTFSQYVRSTFTFKRATGLQRFRFNTGTMDVFDTLHHYLISSVITSTEGSGVINRPGEFELHQNYPNPFNPTTAISYSLPFAKGRGGVGSLVTLKIYDVLGREIATLVNEAKPRGKYEVMFDASNLSSGVYFYRLTAGSFSQTRKLLLVR